jgi:hypothetical protein
LRKNGRLFIFNGIKKCIFIKAETAEGYMIVNYLIQCYGIREKRFKTMFDIILSSRDLGRYVYFIHAL